MSRSNSIHLRMGDVEMDAKETPAPESGDLMECYCPHCRVIGHGTTVMDIVQFGFFADSTITVFWCQVYGRFYYVKYALDHDDFNLTGS